MTRFVVDLGDVALSKEAVSAINADIQRAVLPHLANIPVAGPVVFKFPRDWWGFILRQDFEAILKGEEALQRGMLQTRGVM